MMEQIKQQNHTPSPLKRLLPIVIIIVLVLVSLKFMSSMKTEPVKTPEKLEGFLVETTTVEPTTLTIKIESQGTLQPQRQISLTAEVSGKVLAMNPSFTAGGVFQAGETLVSLDPADYQVAVARADANVASAQAQLDLEQAKSDQAKKDWQSLGKKGQPSALLLNIPQLDGAKASLRAAKADLQKANRDLEKTAIKAPFDGTVITQSIDLGQFIAVPGSMGIIAGTAIAEVRLPLSNNDLTKLNIEKEALKQAPLTVEFFSGKNQTAILGQIKQLESSKDSRTLMTYAVAQITEPFAQGLLFNSFLQAQITGQTYDSVFAIPTAWMMPNNQLSVYQADGTLAIKSVNVVHKTNDYFYIDSGLTAKDAIVTTPIQAAEVGMKLRLKNQVRPSEVEQ